MDGTTPAETDGLQEYFAPCDANVDIEAERCACPMGNSTQGRRLEPNDIHRRDLLPIIQKHDSSMVKESKGRGQANSEEQTEDYGVERIQCHGPGRLSFVQENYGWPLLHSNPS